MHKKEADFGMVFRQWLRAHPQHSCAYELKQTTSTYISFNALEQHQADYLQAIRHSKGVLVRVQGTNGEPDYIWLNEFPASVVIRFPGEFHIISIDTFLLEKKRSVRKSLTSLRAAEISTVTVKLK